MDQHSLYLVPLSELQLGCYAKEEKSPFLHRALARYCLLALFVCLVCCWFVCLFVFFHDSHSFYVLILRFNQVVRWIGTLICSEPNSKERRKVIAYFIIIAVVCSKIIKKIFFFPLIRGNCSVFLFAVFEFLDSHCQKYLALQNYQGIMQVFVGLTQYPVSRLKESWAVCEIERKNIRNNGINKAARNNNLLESRM
jgi:hypothetical protein